MQYETIILELMSRIKKLEEDVEELKLNQRDSEINSTRGFSIDGSEGMSPIDSTVSYQKMTDEMIDICYKCGKKVFEGENAQELADDVANETGMNRNSALMYIYVVSEMLGGTIFKRAISARALKKYFDTIFNEYGSAGLRKAIKATKLHIGYRRECGHQVDSIEELCDKYENRL